MGVSDSLMSFGGRFACVGLRLPLSVTEEPLDCFFAGGECLFSFGLEAGRRLGDCRCVCGVAEDCFAELGFVMVVRCEGGFFYIVKY